MATRCPGKNHHVRQQRQRERNIEKIKFSLERDFPVAAHFARMVGLTCEDEVTRSYGEEGKTLAASINPETIPGAEPFPENIFQPIVMHKRDLERRNKITGNSTMDAKWNKCAKSARIKWRKRNNDDTLTFVDRFHRDLGDSELNDRRPWKDAMAEQWKLKEFTLQHAMEFDEICDEAELAKEAAEDDPFKQSRKKISQVFGDHHVILASDAFKGTGVQTNKCGEFGKIVAQQRVLRGKSASDNPQTPPFAKFLDQERSSRTKLQIAMFKKHQILVEHPVPMIERVKPLNPKEKDRKIKGKQSNHKIKDSANDSEFQHQQTTRFASA